MTDRDDSSIGDIELLGATARGDHDAFRLLVERYRRKIFSTCFGFVRDPHEAEDLTQDVFFQIYRNAARFRGESAVSTWIYRIAVHHSLNRVRKHRARKWLQYFGTVETSSLRLDNIAGSGDLPEQSVENRERNERLRQALDRLPRRQRVAFTLHKVHGISYEEIARITNSSISAVESRIHRAKLNLQKYLVDLFRKRK